MLLVVGSFGDFVWSRLQVHIEIAADGGRERGNEAVVVGLWNRVEFVVVTAGTADGETEHGTAHRGGHVVEGVVASAFDFVGRDLRGKDPGTQKAGGFEGQRIFRLEFVAGELPADELIVGHVLVQGLDDEIAEVIGEGAVVVLLEAVAFGEAGGVEPVAGPTFAVVLRIKQLVDEGFIGFRVGDHRWQAD